MVKGEGPVNLTPDLTEYDWLVLQETRSVSGVTLDEVWSRIQYHKPKGDFQFKSTVEPSLLRLNSLGLVRSLELEGHPLWLRTPQGDLVFNWRTQLSWPEPGPEPRPGETGNNRPSAAPCDQYRPFHGQPAYCWCGWIRTEHPTEAQQSKEATP